MPNAKPRQCGSPCFHGWVLSLMNFAVPIVFALLATLQFRVSPSSINHTQHHRKSMEIRRWLLLSARLCSGNMILLKLTNGQERTRHRIKNRFRTTYRQFESYPVWLAKWHRRHHLQLSLLDAHDVVHDMPPTFQMNRPLFAVVTRIFVVNLPQDLANHVRSLFWICSVMLCIHQSRRQQHEVIHHGVPKEKGVLPWRCCPRRFLRVLGFDVVVHLCFLSACCALVVVSARVCPSFHANRYSLFTN